eukprot:TRINITY_DN11485_c0_g1_i13.p2 TRINITY_DN11485_c0_g1~~TRINITY_DN11485_c0_g1_i13.p2  ORF type:complete len:103 (+),score=9.81 TRINITY_DN11485_c0_g1_i13:1001-1309(+)
MLSSALTSPTVKTGTKADTQKFVLPDRVMLCRDESHNATVRAILETSLSTGRMPTWDEYRRIIDHGADLSSIDPSIHEVVDRVLESGQWHLLLDFECKERDA